MTDSPGRVACVENESAGFIHGEPCLHSLPLNSCTFISDRASDNIWFLCSSRSILVWYSASESLDRAACSP